MGLRREIGISFGFTERDVFILISHKPLELLWGYRKKEKEGEEMSG